MFSFLFFLDFIYNSTFTSLKFKSSRIIFYKYKETNKGILKPSFISQNLFMTQNNDNIILKEFSNIQIKEKQIFDLIKEDYYKFKMGDSCLNMKSEKSWYLGSCENKSSYFISDGNYNRQMRNNEEEKDEILDLIQTLPDYRKNGLVIPPPGHVDQNPILKISEIENF